MDDELIVARDGRTRRFSFAQIVLALNVFFLFILIIMVGVAIQKIPASNEVGALTTTTVSKTTPSTPSTSTTTAATPTMMPKKDRSGTKRCMARVAPPTNYIPHKPLLILNATIVDEKGSTAGQNILVQNGRITTVSSAPPDASSSSDRFVLDAMGHVVTAGIVRVGIGDFHIFTLLCLSLIF
jgi:hypothetical protein